MGSSLHVLVAAPPGLPSCAPHPSGPSLPASSVSTVRVEGRDTQETHTVHSTNCGFLGETDTEVPSYQRTPLTATEGNSSEATVCLAPGDQTHWFLQRVRLPFQPALPGTTAVCEQEGFPGNIRAIPSPQYNTPHTSPGYALPLPTFLIIPTQGAGIL